MRVYLPYEFGQAVKITNEENKNECGTVSGYSIDDGHFVISVTFASKNGGRGFGVYKPEELVPVEPEELLRYIQGGETPSTSKGKTRLKALLDVFPNIKLGEDGYPSICISEYDKERDTSLYDCPWVCEDCRKKFWEEEIERVNRD